MSNNGNMIVSEYLWLFSRYDSNLRYSVVFFIDKNGKMIPSNKPAFCFFPTKETTGLNFMIHAPFLLTDSREGIRAGIEHNKACVRILAKLTATSLIHLRDIGEAKSQRIIDDSIIEIIPLNEDDFCELDDTDSISFLPFYNEIEHMNMSILLMD